MEIKKDALLRVVKATRMSMRMAECMKGLLADENAWTTADMIAGFLKDALFCIAGEELTVGENFLENSMTMRLLTGDMDDESVTDWFIMMDNIRNRHLKPQGEELPKPQTMSKEDMRSLYQKNGGYMTPEGDWK